MLHCDMVDRLNNVLSKLISLLLKTIRSKIDLTLLLLKHLLTLPRDLQKSKFSKERQIRSRTLFDQLVQFN
jgi:hypothetical protein